MNATYTIVQFEESHEQYYNGIQNAVTVCQNAAEVSEFVFKVILSRISYLQEYCSSEDREFALSELVGLGMPEQMKDVFLHSLLLQKNSDVPLILAKDAGWMDIPMQDLLLFLNEDANDRITWTIIQGAPIVSRPRPARPAEEDKGSPCSECGEILFYDSPGCKCERTLECKMCNRSLEETEAHFLYSTNFSSILFREEMIVCNDCMGNLDEYEWVEGG